MATYSRVLLSCSILLSTLLQLPAFAADDPKATVPPAPIPAQILAGKKAFIANAGTNFPYLNAYIASHTGAPNGLYDEFYAAMKNWGRYELASTPAEADIVLEISLIGAFPAGSEPFFQLRIIDPKTHTVLWTLVQDVLAGSGREASRIKAWDQALENIVDNLKSLVSPQPATTDTQSK
jgi:hypothetical protein